MNGFTKIPNELMRNPLLSPTEKTVWGVIASTSEDYNPTIATYCAMVRCHFNTWRAVIRMLRGFGMVTVEHSGNRVRYNVVTEPSKWTLPNNICEGKGNNNCEGHPNNICDPLKEHIKEQKKNNIDDDARTRVREEVMSDAMVEMGCMSLGIDRGTYENLAFQVFTDWDFQNLPDGEWTKTHFLAVMRYKVSDYKKSNNNGQRTITNGNKRVTGFKILNKA
jgi:hypothetical protein